MKSNKSFPSFIFVSIILLILAATMNSCEKASLVLGENFVSNNTTQIHYVDTSTIEMSTIYVDSFVTSRNGALFTGHYSDPAFGKINAESYARLDLPSAFDIPEGASFDSIEVILKTNQGYYGDTTVPYTISISQLSNAITFPSAGQAFFYNIDSWPYNPASWATKSLYFRPASTDSISLRLPDAIGRDLFDKLYNHSEEVSSNDVFNQYFKGLALTASGPGNNLMVGFSESVIMRLYYKEPGVVTKDVFLDFNISPLKFGFSHITADRTGTPIASLGPNNNRISSAQTGNAAFSQFITGSMVKIRFPYLRSLKNLPNFVKIISAQLIIKPVAKTYSFSYGLPPYLQLSTTDQYNQTGPPILDPNSSSSQSAVPQYGNLVIDYLYGTGTQYIYDVSSYLQAQIEIEKNNENGLLVLPPNPANIFNRIVIGDAKNTNGQTQLKVYYASVQ
jgi:hypothetical protein